PPLRRDPLAPAPAGGLSYSALSSFERCGYRFYAERMLGIAGPDEPAAADRPGSGDQDAGDQDAAEPTARQRFGPGVAVHALLEWSARHSWRAPDADRVAAALREEGLGPRGELARQVEGLVGAWLDSPLRAELGDAGISAELPFVLPVGAALIRGSIDLLAERPDGSVLVIDYKSDRLDGADPDSLADRYAVQRDLYALAASARGAPVETAYVFLERPGDPVRTEFYRAELDAARERVESVLARLARGGFAVTEHPHRALCHDCPARERLCSHTTAAQMRDEPDPAIVPIPRSQRDREDGGASAADSVAGPSADASGDAQLNLLD
ncbi:MAG: RecB family exonuclease, partial [Solirubrobacterales bacterium]